MTQRGIFFFFPIMNSAFSGKGTGRGRWEIFPLARIQIYRDFLGNTKEDFFAFFPLIVNSIIWVRGRGDIPLRADPDCDFE